MLEWFYELTPLYRILVLSVVVFFLVFAAPSVKINAGNLVKAFLFLIAAVLLYFLWSGDDPSTALKRISQPPSTEEPGQSVPKYYQDPEKRWGNNR